MKLFMAYTMSFLSVTPTTTTAAFLRRTKNNMVKALSFFIFLSVSINSLATNTPGVTVSNTTFTVLPGKSAQFTVSITHNDTNWQSATYVLEQKNSQVSVVCEGGGIRLSSNSDPWRPDCGTGVSEVLIYGIHSGYPQETSVTLQRPAGQYRYVAGSYIAGVGYNYQFSNYGGVSYSNVITIIEDKKPGLPRNLTVNHSGYLLDTSSSKFKLDWDAPNTGPRPSTGHALTYQVNFVCFCPTTATGLTATEHTFPAAKDMVVGEHAYFVRAVYDDNGTPVYGDWSEIINFTINDKPVIGDITAKTGSGPTSDDWWTFAVPVSDSGKPQPVVTTISVAKYTDLSTILSENSCVFDEGTGNQTCETVSWTPSTHGHYQVSVSATDSVETVTKEELIWIAEPNNPPVASITSSPSSVVEESPISITYRAYDTDHTECGNDGCYVKTIRLKYRKKNDTTWINVPSNIANAYIDNSVTKNTGTFNRTVTINSDDLYLSPTRIDGVAGDPWQFRVTAWDNENPSLYNHSLVVDVIVDAYDDPTVVMSLPRIQDQSDYRFDENVVISMTLTDTSELVQNENDLQFELTIDRAGESIEILLVDFDTSLVNPNGSITYSLNWALNEDVNATVNFRAAGEFTDHNGSPNFYSEYTGAINISANLGPTINFPVPPGGYGGSDINPELFWDNNPMTNQSWKEGLPLTLYFEVQDRDHLTDIIPVTDITVRDNGSPLGLTEYVEDHLYKITWIPNYTSGKHRHTIQVEATDGEIAQPFITNSFDITITPASEPQDKPILLVNGQPGPVTITDFPFIISWNHVAGAVLDQAIVTESKAGTSDNTLAVGALGSETTVVYSLNNRDRINGTYTYTVQACNGFDPTPCGPISDPITVIINLAIPAPVNFTDDTKIDFVNTGGGYILEWEPTTDPTFNKYELQEKAFIPSANINGLCLEANPPPECFTDFQDIQLVDDTFNAHYFDYGKAVGTYTYRVCAYNDYNEANICNFGQQFVLQVLPPTITGVAFCDNPEKDCVQVDADYMASGFDGGSLAATVTLTALNDSAITHTYSAGKVQWTAIDGLEVDLTADPLLYDAATTYGVRITVTNPNGSKGNTVLYADGESGYIHISESAPAIGFGNFIYVSSGKELWVLDPNTGQERGLPVDGGVWPFKTSGEIRSTPVINPVDGTVYIGSEDHNLYAVYPFIDNTNSGGTDRWTRLTEGKIIGAPVLETEPGEDLLYVGSMDANLYAIHLSNGEIFWTYPAGESIAESPILDGNGVIYITTVDGTVHAIKRGDLGANVLVWDSVDDGLLKDQMELINWWPTDEDKTNLLRIGRAYKGLLHPDLPYSKNHLRYWTFALVTGASMEEVVNAFLNSDKGTELYPATMTIAEFVDALFLRLFPFGTVTEVTYDNKVYNANTLATSGLSRAEIVIIMTDSIEYSEASDAQLLLLINYLFKLCVSGEEEACVNNEDSDITGPDGLPDWWEMTFFGDLDTVWGSKIVDPDKDPTRTYLDVYNEGENPCGKYCYTGINTPNPVNPASDPGLSSVGVNGVGAITGSFRVSESGSATYAIPIYAPVGIAGVTPQVSLNYNSTGGNGLVGKGWSIGGLSGITRCRQTRSQDNGNISSITFTSEDRFCLDGQRLVPEDGAAYGSTGVTYRTEIDNYTVVTPNGSADNPDSFTVERKDGSVSEYGNTASSVLTVGGSGDILSWAINQFSDNVGNSIDFTYTNDDNFGHRIDEIKYAGGYASIKFGYDLGNRADKMSSYINGYELEVDALLSSITVYNSSDSSAGASSSKQEVRSYILKHVVNITDQKTELLRTVTECVVNDCLQPTTFTWTEPTAAEIYYVYKDGRLVEAPTGLGKGFKYHSIDVLNLQVQKDQAATQRVIDINGDGLMDLVWLMPDYDNDGEIHDHYLDYAISDGNKLVHDTTTTKYKNTANPDKMFRLEVLDYNADGRQDVAIFNTQSSRWDILLSVLTEKGWRLSANRLDSPDIDAALTSNFTRFIDINGDGLVDAIDKSQYYLLEKGTDISSNHYYQFADGVDFTWDGLDEWATVTPCVGSRSGWDNCDELVRYFLPGAGDFDGDGSVDLIAVDAKLRWIDSGGVFGSNGYSYIAKEELRVYAVRHEAGNLTVVKTLVGSDDAYIATCGRARYCKSINNFLLEVKKDKQQFDLVDVNNDGLTDIIHRTRNTNNDYVYNLLKNTGDMTTPNNNFAALKIAEDSEKFKFNYADYDMDGYADLFWHSNNALFVRLWNQRDKTFETTAESIFGHFVAGQYDAHMFLDMNADGAMDYVHFDTTNYILSVYGSANDGRPNSLIHNINNGMGVSTDVAYGTLTTSGVYQRKDVTFSVAEHCARLQDESRARRKCLLSTTTTSDTEAASFYSEINGDWDLPEDNHTLGKPDPVMELISPVFVVTNIKSTAPATSDTSSALSGVNPYAVSSITYQYSEAKISASGRGLLGFKTITSVDDQSHVSTTTTYRQDFPFIGSPLSTEVSRANGTVISSAVNTWQLQGGISNPEAPYRPFIQKSVESAFDFNSGSPLSTVTTTNIYDDHGNVTFNGVETADLINGTDFKQETSNQYNDSDFSAEYNKRYGRLSRSAVMLTRDDSVTMITRVSKFDYYGADNETTGAIEGQLATETVTSNAAGSTTLIEQHYTYDTNGNTQSKTVQGYVDLAKSNYQERTTTYNYDEIGRYLVESLNDNGHRIEKVGYRDKFGSPSSIIDIYNNTVDIYYDHFGREYFRRDNMGGFTETMHSTGNLGTSCPTSARYFVTTESAGGSKSIACFDALGREIMSGKRNFNDDSYWGVRTQYDSRGRVKHKTIPHDVNAETYPAFTTITYDDLGRATNIIHPDSSTSSTSYTDFSAKSINDKGQKKTEDKNALGDLILVTDDDLTTISYGYDPAGNLAQTVTDGIEKADGVGGPIIVKMGYDHNGRKTSMDDPDKGAWTYFYNDFGELVEQHNANAEKTVMVYNELGQMKSRDDIDAFGVEQSTTSWTFDPAFDRLTEEKHSSTLNDFSEKIIEPFYDLQGRAEILITTINGVSYTQKTTYDEYGRVFQKFDASGNQRGIEYRYNDAGYVYKLLEAMLGNGIQRPYITYNMMDAWGHITQEQLGNGLTTDREYDPETGRLYHLQTSKVGWGDLLQDLTLSYDTLGNLETKADDRRDFIEYFCYDDLNRLTGAAINNVCGNDQYKYDSFGNITDKDDVTDYYYGTNAGPHAVTYADSIDYKYDNNGNMIEDKIGTVIRRSIDYTAFDKPYKINKGNATISFRYGGDRSRYRRVDELDGETTTTHYVGNVEFIDRNGSKEIKRNIAGFVVVTEEHDTQGKLIDHYEKYLLKDQIGSVDIITGATGEITGYEKLLSYDAWGHRRYSDNLEPLLIQDDWKAINLLTTRGFTGHEMLDAVGLIHMNGRIYDPTLGRFLQADPTIDGVTNTQGYNRYSYVHNNPLSYTDPSGYGASGGVWNTVKIFVAAVASYMCGGTCTAQVYAALFATTGAVQARNQGGSTGDIATAAFSGAVMGYLGGSFGTGGMSFESFVGWSALAGGITAELQGGKFGHGFAAAGLGSAAGGIALGNIAGPLASMGRTLVRSVIGGTLSKITGGKFANGAAFAAFASILSEVANATKDDVIVTGQRDKPKAVPKEDWARPTIDTSKSYDTWDEAKQALDVAIIEAKNSGNSNWEYGGITVQQGHGAVARFYNSNIVTSRLTGQIAWSTTSLLNINASTPIIALHHYHPLGFNGVPKAFSDADKSSYSILKAAGFNKLQGIYMRDRYGVRAYRSSMGKNGWACKEGISMC